MRRIGEILVGARAISEKVRDEILEYMRVHKVPFGTAVLETGALPEETLLRALSVQASTPPVGSSDLVSIPPDIIRLVPQKLAKKHTALPFRKVGRTLYLAMARPLDRQGADEIAFLTGLTAVPHIAITARLHVALEQYYGILAAPRYKALVAKLDGAMNPTPTSIPRPARPERPEPQPDRPPASRIPSAFFQIPLLEDAADPWKVASEPVEKPSEEKVHVETLAPAWKLGEKLTPLEFTPETPEPRQSAPQAMQTAAAPALDLPSRLARAEEKDEIGYAILESLKSKLDTVALFVVQGDHVNGWQARPEPPEPPRNLSVPFSEPSVFASLRNTSGVFAGPCPDTAADRLILESIGLRFPAVIGVVPVTARSRTVLFLLGESIGGVQGLQIPLLKRYAAMAMTALEILALKNRLKKL